MKDHFKEDDSSARCSDEFLLEQLPRPKKLKHRKQNIMCIALVAIGILIGVIELIVLETIVVSMSSKSCGPPILSELNTLVPNFALRQVLFRKDPSATFDHQSEVSRNQTRDNWLSYVPKGNGFIAVNSSAEYTLPEPINYKGKDVYSIAVFHQMHCLYAIMDVYNDLSSSSTRHTGRSDHDHDHEHLGAHAHNHVDHCFRYLRQSLMCCGDTALEGQDPNLNVLGTDGTGAVHMCKDYEAIQLWAENNRIVDTRHL